MQHLIAFCLILYVFLIHKPHAANADQLGVNDLLIPEEYASRLNDEGIKSQSEKKSGELNIDDLLGPKDIFPFLPDNHRDSGSGKFNTF